MCFCIIEIGFGVGKGYVVVVGDYYDGVVELVVFF